MIWYIQKDLRPSVRVEIEQRGQELDSFEKLIKKAIDAKAKAALWPCSYACNTNQRCLRDSWLSAAKASTQSQLIKDSSVKEPKSGPQESKVPASERSNSAETSEKARKKKKKKDKRHQGQKPQESSTPTTGSNLINLFVGKP